MNLRPLVGTVVVLGVAIAVPAAITLLLATTIALVSRSAPTLDLALHSVVPALSTGAGPESVVQTAALSPLPADGVAQPVRRELGVQIVEGSLTDPQSWTFEPPVVRANVGDRVTWTNAGSLPHTVTAENAAFDSGLLEKGKQWSFTADRPGTFPYICDFHPEMQGTLVVGGAGEAPAFTSTPAGTTPTGTPRAVATPTASPPATPTAVPQPPATSTPVQPPAGGNSISAQIVASGFNPATINAAIGDRITWTNTDGRKHTVAADGGAFDSGILNPGGQWSLTAGRAGTFPYRCDLHPEMVGTLVVAAAGSPAPTPQPTAPTPPATATTTPPQPTPTPTTALAAAPARAEIALSGSAAYPGASGRARYENTGARRELRVDVQGIATLRWATLDVFVGGSRVGSMAVTDGGDARLELSTDKGATTLPASVAGQTLEVRTGASVIVVSGRFS